MTIQLALSTAIRELLKPKILAGDELGAYQRAATGCLLPTTQRPDGKFDDPSTQRMLGIWREAIAWTCKRLQAAVAAPASDGDLHIGVSNNDQGVHINIMQRQADGTATVIYTAKAPAGDSYGRASLAAPVAQSTAGAGKDVGSIEDYAQFHNLLGDWMRARDYWQDDAATQVVEKWQKFIAYIDARLAAPAAQATAPTAEDSEDLETALRLLGNLKRDLEHARRFSPDTLATYRRACSSAEGDIEEFLLERRDRIRALRTASKDQQSELGEKGGDDA